jgi:hypothetical protein
VWKLSYAMKDGLLPIAGEKSGLAQTVPLDCPARNVFSGFDDFSRNTPQAETANQLCTAQRESTGAAV